MCARTVVAFREDHPSDDFNLTIVAIGCCSMLKQFDAFSEDLIKIFTRQIVEGVMYLHAMGVVHRDIKGACAYMGRRATRLLSRDSLNSTFDEADLSSSCRHARWRPAQAPMCS